MSRDWFVFRGPNGGYLGAMLMKALEDAVEPARRPRSLTVHYLAMPSEGPVSVGIESLRSGAKFTFLSARMKQGDETMAVALAAFSDERAGREFHEEQMPAVKPASEIEPFPIGPPLPPYAAHWEMRSVFDSLPFTNGERAEAGGWVALREPRPFDPPLVTALTDAWFPAVFPRLPRVEVVPTIDLTIHFRADLPLPSLAPGDPVLALFRSRHAAGGFVEEDGQLWAPGGALIAQSRQLALLDGSALG